MFITGIDEQEADGAVAGYCEAERAAWDFLPNYARALSSRREVAAAWGALNATVRDVG